MIHEHYMRLAIKQAQIAYSLGEIPVGAVVVAEATQQILAQTHNLTEQLTDVTAHAEILAITAATQHIGAKYLNHCTLYITLEPCVMCAGAIAWAQLGRVVWAASDAKRGISRLGDWRKTFHPKTDIITGVLAGESEALLKDFFAHLRG